MQRSSAAPNGLRYSLVAGINKVGEVLFKPLKWAISRRKAAIFQWFSTSLNTTRCSGCYF